MAEGEQNNIRAVILRKTIIQENKNNRERERQTEIGTGSYNIGLSIPACLSLVTFSVVKRLESIEKKRFLRSIRKMSWAYSTTNEKVLCKDRKDNC